MHVGHHCDESQISSKNSSATLYFSQSVATDQHSNNSLCSVLWIRTSQEL